MRAMNDGTDLQARIAQWLLQGPAQLRNGEHAGSVAGLVEMGHSPSYAYPEITGYYLQWLAWRAMRYGHHPDLARVAAAAQAWLSRWIADDWPLTRIPILGAGADWRNDAVFFFDLAMVLRGVASAARLGLIEPEPKLVEGLSRQLQWLIGVDGLIDAYRDRAGRNSLPLRWSTCRGGFLAKAAGGIIAAGSVLQGIDEALAASAAATYAASLEWAVDMPHDDVHPLLYTFEGILALPQHPQFSLVLPRVAAQFASLLAEASALGWPPESRSNAAAANAPKRLDVVAQAIRVGRLLELHGSDPLPDEVAMTRLAQLLGQHVRPDGSVPFSVQSPPRQSNVWAAMFAEQALGFTHADNPLTAAELGSLLA